MKNDYNYKFYGDFNTIIKDKLFYAFALITVFIFLPITFVYGIIGFIVCFILVISSLVFILNKFNSEDNLILFTEKNMIRIIKDSEVEINYEDIVKVEFHYPFKYQSYIKITLKNQVLKFTQETSINKNFPFSTLVELLFHKNNTIEINEFVPFEKHKYFLHNGEVKKVQID
jgi:hypothetical protein